LGKVTWPNSRTVGANVTIVFLTVVILIAVLGALELAVGGLASALFAI
jgi:preprotein translocase SecE subunit